MGQGREHGVDNVGLERVGHQHHGSDKRRLERLLNHQLHGQRHKRAAEALVVVVVGHQARNRLHLLGPSAQRRVGNAEELSSKPHRHGRRVDPPSLLAAVVMVIVVYVERGLG